MGSSNLCHEKIRGGARSLSRVEFLGFWIAKGKKKEKAGMRFQKGKK